MELLEEYFDTAFDAPDGIKKLRELILTLAMQGKLVPQNPEDQPASELLKEIEAEKQRLIQEKKIKKQKALPAIKPEEIPFEIPAGWEWTNLSCLSAKIHYGYTASALKNAVGIKLLRITDIQNNKVNWETVPTCSAKREDVLQYLLNSDDILIARTGGTVGKSYRVEEAPTDAVFASYLIRLIPSELINVRFLKYFLESPLYWNQLYAACSGTGQPNVNGKSLSRLSYPLPPSEEQSRIVTRIDQLMARCDELEKLRAAKEGKRVSVHTSAVRQLLEAKQETDFAEAWQFLTDNFGDLYSVKENVAELRKAILQLAVMGKLVPQDAEDQPASELLKEIEAEKLLLIKEKKIKKQKALPAIKDEEIPFDVPAGWEWVRIRNTAQSIDYGTSIKTCDDPTLVPVYRMGNIHEGQLIDDNFKYVAPDIKDLPKLYLEKKDILFNRTNSYELVGKSAVYTGKNNFATLASYLIRVRLFNTKVEATYINVAMNAPYFRKTQIEPEIVQQCGQANFNGTKLSSCLIPIPPLKEQKRILRKVDQLMTLCDNLEQQIDNATEKQTALLNSLMAQV